MIDNELIAEWLGATKDCNEFVIGELCIWGNGKTFRAVEEMGEDGEDVQFWKEWSPSTDIALWNGDDRLLKKIEEKGLRNRFMYMLWNISGIREASYTDDNERDATAWAFMNATTDQLTAALVAVIKEE